jgi:site-specific DNA-methyltransferase (adenine-specific)
MPMEKDNITPRIHPTQKPIHTIKQLIELFTDIGEVVIDPCAGSGVTLLAAKQLNRRAYGFEIKKEFVKGFYEKLLVNVQQDLFSYSA